MATQTKKTDIWTLVDKCVFCHTLSDGKHKLLYCLHIVCKTCIDVKMTKSGILCLCLELSETELADYPIISPDIQKSKTCNIHDCEATVKIFCQVCQVFYCGPCANVHLNSNRDHKKTHMIEYPIVIKLYVCSCCKVRDVEVYCSKCTVTTCSICHLTHHNDHEHTILEQLAYTLRNKFSSKILNLEKHNAYLSFFLELIQNELNDLNNKYKSLDITTNVNGLQSRLLTELNKHNIRPYTVVFHNVEISRIIANANIRRYMDLLQKNMFYIRFTQSILTNSDVYNIIKIAAKVWNKLFDVEHTIEFSPKEFKEKDFNMSINFDDKALESCIAKIKACIKLIISLQPTSSVDILNDSDQQNDQETKLKDFINNTECHREVKEEIESISSSDSNVTENSSILDCICCNQWALDEKLIKCMECDRCYHYYCHIPRLPSHYVDNEQIRATWKCTMCKDISIVADVLSQRTCLNNVILGRLEQIIINRILLELYCQNYDSEHFRDCPDKKDEPEYYKKIVNPISLNDIKTRLEAKTQSYIFINDILKDMMMVFSNAMMYYASTDPYYIAASSLQKNLIEMVNKWIPNMYHCLEY